MGRPKAFDEQAVLAAAGDLFWARGFEGTSTRDLAEATGLTASSIYNEFGDKRGFYLRVLDHYLEHTLRERIGRLETTLSPARAIAGYFAEIVERSIADEEHRGCMLVNSAIDATAADPELRRAVVNDTLLFEQFFLRCIVAGRRSGEIPPGPAPEDLARHLLATSFGLRVLARVRPEPELLRSVVRPVLTMLGLDASVAL